MKKKKKITNQAFILDKVFFQIIASTINFTSMENKLILI